MMVESIVTEDSMMSGHLLNPRTATAFHTLLQKKFTVLHQQRHKRRSWIPPVDFTSSDIYAASATYRRHDIFASMYYTAAMSSDCFLFL